MRIVLTLLILAMVGLGVWTFAIAPEHGWWWPEPISSYGGDIDRLFNVIMVMIAITFIGTEVALAYTVFAFPAKKPGKAWFTHGSHRLEQIWTAIPAAILLWLAFVQMGTFAEIKFDKHFPEGEYSSIEKPFAEVYASQFDWRVRYPDEEGNFRGVNAVEVPFDFYVPVGEKIVFNLSSRDVLHSFFVPALRLKQDAVPGMIIPQWFEVPEKIGSYDLICAELCGWGHYKMAGRLHVLSRPDFDAWLADQRKALMTNGTEDLE
jgi:cytochrome c oxidase subunit 2